MNCEQLTVNRDKNLRYDLDFDGRAGIFRLMRNNGPVFEGKPGGAAGAGLVNGPVGITLLKLTAPMIFGILSMALYNLVDAYFVGRLGKLQLAALSFTFPVVLVASSIAHGIGMGAGALISTALGAGDMRLARRLSADSLALTLLAMLCFALAGMATINPLFRLLGAEESILPYIRTYMLLWYPGTVFVVLPIVGNYAIRSTGDSLTPALLMITGAVINAALDPLLIFGIGPFPAWGIKGAAMATLIGKMLTFVAAFYALVHRDRLVVLSEWTARGMSDSWGQILYLGIPNIGTRLIVPLGMGIVTRIAASHGYEAVAGYGIGTRVEYLSLSVVYALAAVIGPFIGQNLGAGRPDRVREGFRKGEHIAAGVGAFFCAASLLLADRAAGLFSADMRVAGAAATYIRIVSAAYALQGIFLVISAGLYVLKKPFRAALLAIMETFFLAVPLAAIGSLVWGFTGVCVAVALSYIITGLAARAALARAAP